MELGKPLKLPISRTTTNGIETIKLNMQSQWTNYQNK